MGKNDGMALPPSGLAAAKLPRPFSLSQLPWAKRHFSFRQKKRLQRSSILKDVPILHAISYKYTTSQLSSKETNYGL